MQAKVRAHANIALIKYWGKRDERLNIPAVGSISLTLNALWTETEVIFSPERSRDELVLNNRQATEAELQRISRFLDLIRSLKKTNLRARVHSVNNFPTAAGLASSASGFAALAVAASEALGLKFSPREWSVLARQGSGSAARSIFGGLVEMHSGQLPDGSDAFAEPLAPPDYWDLRLLIGITSARPKKIGSTEGMNRSRETSPYYRAWTEGQPADLQEMRQAIRQKDFQKLGELSEHSCLKMHALAMSSRPGILYWNAITVDAMHAVRELRSKGIAAYFTIDAGPQIKVLCLPEDEVRVRDMLRSINGIERIVVNKPGSGVQILERQND